MNSDLLLKYNVPTPRYTSYPPANYFHEGFTADDYREAVVSSNQVRPENISFYIHIPFCPRLCYYCGCNSYPMAKADIVSAYVDAVKKEIMHLLPLIDKNRKISQIHYGGGTPTAIPLHYLKEINELLLSSFSCIEHPEIAIECHPGYLNEAHWLQLVEAGFNRCSIGVQDFNTEVLRIANRVPALLPMEDIFSILREHQVSVNLDFIYGLPQQTVGEFVGTIEKAISLRPDRLVTFSYAHVPWVNKNQLLLEKAGLPSAEDKRAMYSEAKKVLTAAGYMPVGLDHFVLPDDSLNIALQKGLLHRNFQGYCTRTTTGQVYAFGVTAISQLATAYSQNTRDIGGYIKTVADGQMPVMRGYSLNTQEQLAREIITTLMCNNRMNWQELSEHLGMEIDALKKDISYDPAVLEEMAADGIITYSPEEINITQEGSLYVRNVAAVFDPLMRNGNAKMYSKPV
ncbi:oxygen-independent coproporphyrinogen III oxidase [uncultured Bacteroides sp.]|uniref:oxygen-independent coproporphyrinogen III oxidase n=1 Tax=uncultured Bacteroides sp. TaxID=162156 RepID=UPI002AA6270C|nr:oxygen-independent coproporphyrinogen III oxidase [uncultured Bacteroides sp.]